MPTLDPALRDQLATVIGKENADTGARIIAEAGAKAAIEALSVHLAAPYAHLDAGQRQLRNLLRARAKQLGDRRYTEATATRRRDEQDIDRLVEQTAYEHWHRMLFARFLAENDLLIHPELKVAVTLNECAELAASEGAVDGWELAGRYASRMLPQIFRPDDALLAVRFAIDDIKKLETLLDSLPAALFRASDSLGWCYQFWQARKKRRVNDSEVKIGADELPAVTQLFTEPYMVQFLLHNTLGAWWGGAGRALPLEMPYLRFTEEGVPAAGVFEGWPRLARELKVLDPCCGSGHFLVAAFEILVAFRIAEEGLSAQAACDAVLRDNLFGLEIDARCVQIAAFALAMAAWTYPGAGGYRPLAPMNVACSGLAISARKEEWERLGGENARLRAGMGRMWELFKDAPVLGSLIDPKKDAPNPIQVARFEEIAPMLARALDASVAADEADEREVRVAAKGLADAATTLGAIFTLVVTNVPYLKRGEQVESLRDYCKTHHARAKADLATTFIDRCLRLAYTGGAVAVVSPQTWLFLDSYKEARGAWLRDLHWPLVARLGHSAFQTITGHVVDVVLTLFAKEKRRNGFVVDAADYHTTGKASALAMDALEPFIQSEQIANADSRVVFGGVASGVLLQAYADAMHGQGTFDNPSYVRRHWEVPLPKDGWILQQTTSTRTDLDHGCTNIMFWQDGEGRLASDMQLKAEAGYTSGKWRAGIRAWGAKGVAIDCMGLRARRYSGKSFDTNIAVIVPKDDLNYLPILAYCRSREFEENVQLIDRKKNITPKTLAKVPFDLSRWTAVASQQFPGDLPAQSSPDPTQWFFDGTIARSEAPLHVAVARLLGFRWPDQQPDSLDAHADKDGIVCVPALRGERPAADRLADLLATAWGQDWHPQTLTDLLAAVGHAGTLEEWLRDAFFKQHCELFHHRPFIWHIWDGHREGFSALVNYHRLDHEGLKSLTYTYLGDWIRTQEIEAKAGKSGAGDKLTKARALQQRLAAILEGEAPLDIFIRWKPIEQQPIGWHPDLDDGVRLNIRPFLTVADVGAKGAGVLRWKPPNIKWGVDDGKNPPGAPWGEVRNNDRHLTLAEKRAARGET